MSTICNVLFSGISLSSILLLAALGLSITFGLMRVINMAHGEFLMIGAYTTYVIQNLFAKHLPDGAFDLYFLVSLVASFAIAFAFGLLLERLVICHLYGRETDSLLATWGISLILQQAARSIFGAANVNVTAPSFLNGNIDIAGVTLTYKRLFIIALVAACIGGVYILMYRTSFGNKMRACMQNRDMAQCLGIQTSRIDGITFALGSGLAAIAGCALTLLGPIGPTLGANYIVDTFMVVVLGGVGRLVGSVAGALLIGIPSTIIEFNTTASIAKALVLLLVIAFLQKKPKGLFTINSRALDE